MRKYQVIIIISVMLISAGTGSIKAQVDSSKYFKDVEDSLNAAISRSVDILFPSEFADAVECYKSAQTSKTDKVSPDKIIVQLDKAQKLLNDIRTDAGGRFNKFKNIISARDSARTEGAGKYFLKLWISAEKKLKAAIRNYADKDTGSVAYALPVILMDYRNAKTHAEYENFLLLVWEPLKNANVTFANLISPVMYKKGMLKYTDALTALAECRDMDLIKQSVNEAGIYFREAADNALKFRMKHQELFTLRNEAITAGAETYSPDIWNEGDENLSEAGVSFLKDKQESSEEFSSVSKQKYSEAKQGALKCRFLSKAGEIINTAAGEDAPHYAPAVFEETTLLINNIEENIKKDSTDYDKLGKLSDSAVVKADLTLKITNTIKSVEAGVTSWENLLLKWNIYGKSKTVQTSEAIAGAIKSVESGKNTWENLITGWNIFGGSKNISRNENKRAVLFPLTDSTKLSGNQNEKPVINGASNIDTVQKVNKIPGWVYEEFKSGEAEFINKGNDIVIRLSGLKFAEKSTELNVNAKKILNKSLRALHYFHYKTLVIAVSSGDLKLSEKRAEKIRSYILSNSRINSSAITSAGFIETNSGIKPANRIEMIIKN